MKKVIIYESDAHLHREKAFSNARELNGWNDYEAILYAAQRSRMLGVNGKASHIKHLNYDKPLVKSEYKNNTSVVLQEMAEGKFFNV